MTRRVKRGDQSRTFCSDWQLPKMPPKPQLLGPIEIPPPKRPIAPKAAAATGIALFERWAQFILGAQKRGSFEMEAFLFKSGSINFLFDLANQPIYVKASHIYVGVLQITQKVSNFHISANVEVKIGHQLWEMAAKTEHWWIFCEKDLSVLMEHYATLDWVFWGVIRHYGSTKLGQSPEE